MVIVSRTRPVNDASEKVRHVTLTVGGASDYEVVLWVKAKLVSTDDLDRECQIIRVSSFNGIGH